ncbi:hypothetical protein ACSZNP_04610 [Aeromonas hydrophila]|uniref:hypothetical protein n=1 Tax=Aeromonas hydrophila TaxID=644 RepID=UPI001C5AC22B|nr:hypothetical protein [Aeromonas hydrophila]MBW3834196.1 hypothetical protein [Aeromonas hydrophila]MBW5266395.1 hypothetical protein [Aeromonas hydrophila]MBW5279570.1 hypothetical protein [Aeromonas hydrophila]
MSQETTEQHHTTKKVVELLSNLYLTRHDSHLSFQEKLDLLLNDFHKRGTEGETLDSVRSTFNGQMYPARMYYSLISEHAERERLYTAAVDIKKSSDWNEIKVHLRNLVFRGLTTLTIGGSIMFIYWLAAKWGIQLPLLRIPV